MVTGTESTLDDFQRAWAARSGRGAGAAPAVTEAVVASVVARISGLAGPDPARYRRIVAELARLVNDATGGRIVAEIDQLEAMALDAGIARGGWIDEDGRARGPGSGRSSGGGGPEVCK